MTLNVLAKQKTAEVLCTSCVYEVTRKGLNDEKLTYCSYAGGLTELEIEVCECSVYVDRRVRKRDRVIGFIQPDDESKPQLRVIRIA